MSRVYIGRLPPRCSERDIERFFKGYGRLRDVVLKNGYGFVEFDNEKDADDVVYDLHGRELRGERIIVEHARLPPGSRGGSRRSGYTGGVGGRERYGPPTRTEYRVIVENLSSRVSWQDLKDMMRKAGDVTYADAHKSQRNDGTVEFSSYTDMKVAIEKFDGYELYGRRLRVYEDRPSRRSPSGSRGRSRSGSRTRRRSNRSHSRDSRRVRSPRRHRDRSESSENHGSGSRHEIADAHSRSVSHHSASNHSRGRSTSHRSEARSEIRNSRSPISNGRAASLNDGSIHRSRSQSRSRSRSDASRSAHSRSRSVSRSPSNRSASESPRRYSDEEMDDRRSASDGRRTSAD